MKTLDAGILSEISDYSYVTAELVEIALSTPLYLTNAGYNIVATTATSGGSQTYLAQGNFISFTSISETTELRINNISINFSAATNTFVNIALSDNYLHRKIRIYKTWFNKSSLVMVGTPLLVYSGSITGASIADTDTETTVSFVTANQFYDFERTAGRLTNKTSQQRFYPGDRGMDYSTAEVADIQWGRV